MKFLCKIMRVNKCKSGYANLVKQMCKISPSYANVLCSKIITRVICKEFEKSF